MIRFKVESGVLKPVLSEEATPEELEISQKIVDSLNGVSTGAANYKTILEGLDKELSKKEYKYQDYIDEQTIQEIENFYTSASGIKPWDSTKQGASLENIDFNFYKGLVPNKVNAYQDAKQAVSFGGKKIQNVDITKQYPDLDSYLHADYTFVGAPGGLPGKPKKFDEYTERLRPPTDRERQILRETLLGKSKEKPESLAEAVAQDFVDVQGEKTFGALSADVLKQTLAEYGKALKQEQMQGLLQNMGLPNINEFKQDIKNSILGDISAGGFVGLSDKTKDGKGLSASLDKSLGLGNAVAYNWQKWFDETLAKRYENMQEIRDPTDAQKVYKLEQSFANNFIKDYLKPRFDTSKSINEFISYMDVKQEEQNVLQTQLASSALKDYANKQAQMYINNLGKQNVVKGFDPKFYWNPELLTGTDVTSKQSLYQQQKTNINEAWNAREQDKAIKDGKTWKQLAYEYGADLNNKDDFARLHYMFVGKDKGYDPVADTYNREDLAKYIQTDLTKALETEKKSFSNPVFKEFVTANAKATEFVNKLNLGSLPTDLQNKLKDLGINEKTDPAEQVKDALTQILSTDPAIEMRQRIQELNEARIKPTQEQLGYGYIQRDTDVETKKEPGGSSLYSVFKRAGYSGSENEFYTEFFPDATDEDKGLTSAELKKSTTKEGLQSLMGFDMPDFSDPFSAFGSLDAMLDIDSTKKAESYTPKRSTYFKYFENEEDEGAPSYFNIGKGNMFGSVF